MKPLHSFLFFCASLFAFLGVQAPAYALSDQQELIERATITAQSMLEDDQYTELQTLAKQAKAIVIVPRMIEAGFLIGGSVGNGIIIARKPTGGWSAPAFLTLSSANVGLIIGGQASEVMITVMTDDGLASLTSNEVSLGGDISLAVGDVGKSTGARATTNAEDDLYVFARSEGLYGGISLEGGLIEADKDNNEAYYGEGATQETILDGTSYRAPKASRLQEFLP